ncbi:50S ribosomal protein L10, partial [Escherichia coli]|uniref:50S ribosomal protein L10 n=1 Tax=Escherichia coli TaxID=562 RepID=UPI003D2F39DA
MSALTWRFFIERYKWCRNSTSTGGVDMSSVLEQKQQLVAEIAEKLRASKSTIIVDYRGLNVAQVTELRKQLREAGIE